MWGGLCAGVCACAQRVHSVGQVSRRHRRRGRQALMSMWGCRTAEGIGGWTMPWKNIGKDQGLIGECKGLWRQRATADQLSFKARATAHVHLLSCLWAQQPCQFGRGGHGRILHWQVLTWAGQWGQVAEEEVHLCWAVAVGQHFFFTASAMWGKQHGGILFSLAGGRPETLGADRYCR